METEKLIRTLNQLSPRLFDKSKTTQNSTFWSQLSQYFIAQQHEWVHELREVYFVQISSFW